MAPPTALEKAEKDRESLKTRADHWGKTVQSHLTTPLPLGKVTRYLGAIATARTKLESVHEEISHNVPDADMGSHTAYYLSLFDQLVDLEYEFETIQVSLTPAPTPPPTATTSSTTPTPSTTSTDFRLPQLEMPKFDGNLQQWTSFKDIFTTAVINQTTLSKAQKLTYLKSSLIGEAARQIQSMTISDANFDIAWDLLKSRYQNERELLFFILRRFTNQPNVQPYSASSLRTVIDVSNECLRSLEVLGRPVDQWDDFIIFTIFSKLDQPTRELWEQSLQDSSIPSLATLFTFLECRLRSLSGLGFNKALQFKPSPEGRRQANPVCHAQTTSSCLCSDDHHLHRCPQFQDMPALARFEVVRKRKLCRNCLRPGHSTHDCSSTGTCRICNKKHHTMIHLVQNPSEQTQQQSSQQQQPVVVNHHSNDDTGIRQAMLATAVVRVEDSHGRSQICRALLDPGSSSCFVTESCCQRLGLTRQRVIANVTGLATAKVGTANRMISMRVSPHFPSNDSFIVSALVFTTVTGRLPAFQCDPTVWPHLQNLQLADPKYHQPANIDILLGGDVFWHQLLDGRKVGPTDSPIAVRSTLGWLIGGPLNAVSSNITVHYADNDLDVQVQRFWELDSTTTTKTPLTKEELECEAHFHNTHRRDDTGRFLVEIPFKLPQPVLGSSRDIALRRLKQLERRLIQNPQYKTQYDDFMDEYLALGHMEKIPHDDINSSKNPTCYLPHHFVLKESSTTTKFRVVFDASAATSSGQSLNKTMLIGPTLQETIANLMMRFRLHNIAFTADIAKMYRQIQVPLQDADMQRILWRKDPSQPVQDYRLLTVTYGTASAPYLATKCLQQLALDEKHSFPLAAEVTLQDFYFDDCMSGSATKDQALATQKELMQMMPRGGFELRKWSSNCPELLQAIPPEYRENNNILTLDMDQTVKTLGVLWNTIQDEFMFKLTLRKLPDDRKLTKRTLLSEVAKIFDPLGWLAPVIVRAKIIIQDVWKLQLQWDDELPESIQKQWYEYYEHLHSLEQLNIPRCLHTNDAVSISLVGFCDASEKAYAAVVYVCAYQHNQQPTISLVSSKTRVAPVKTISLPRLELCGAVLLSNLMTTIKQALRIQFTSIKAYTDSTVVLAWINSHPSRWKTFVANRITEIQDHIPSKDWAHVSGEENPADCASRGIDPSEIQKHPFWWAGPTWLQQGIQVKASIQNDEPCTTNLEEKIVKVNVLTTTTNNYPLLNKFSKLRILTRVTAWLFRFCKNCQAKIAIKKNQPQNDFPVSGPLTPSEVNTALIAWIKFVQQDHFGKEIQSLQTKKTIPPRSRILTMNPFLDTNQLLRVGGRLRNAEQLPVERKHPILLPRHSKLTELIIAHEHLKNLHAGPQLLQSIVNKRFWIVAARDAIRHQIRKCFTCTRQAAATQQQLMGDLPAPRVNQARAFLKTGIDYAGPFTLRSIASRSKVTFKAYLAIFVCFVTRAIHIEVVSALSTEAFLAALKRFVSRRGQPSDIFSDCGTNFVGAANELKEINKFIRCPKINNQIAEKMTDVGVTWHFNPAGAPHFGGLWEAGVKSVKFHLRRILGETRLTYEELTTTVTQIESILNSRPLTPLSSDPSDLEALTPGHFLIQDKMTAVPDYDLTTEKTGRLSRWQLLQQMTQHFWQRWASEYITRLQQRPKWLQIKNQIKLNSLVLIKDERLKPLHWKLGRVTNLHPGADGAVRVVTIRTAEGEIQRPIVKLCLLPLDNEPEQSVNSD